MQAEALENTRFEANGRFSSRCQVEQLVCCGRKRIDLSRAACASFQVCEGRDPFPASQRAQGQLRELTADSGTIGSLVVAGNAADFVSHVLVHRFPAPLDTLCAPTVTAPSMTAPFMTAPFITAPFTRGRSPRPGR